VVGEGVAVVPSPRISFSSSLAKSWEYGIVGVTISLGIGCSSRFWDPVASMGLSVSMVLLYGDKVWFGSGLVPCFLLPLGGFGLVLVTVLPEDSSANLLFGEGLLLLVREVVELVFLEAGLGAFSTCLVFSLFYRRCCRGAANSIEKDSGVPRFLGLEIFHELF